MQKIFVVEHRTKHSGYICYGTFSTLERAKQFIVACRAEAQNSVLEYVICETTSDKGDTCYIQHHLKD